MTDAKFQDKVALITGASGGIGQATAYDFAEHGAKVVIADIDDEQGAQTVEQINSTGHDASFVHTDVSKPHEVKRAVQTALDEYGRLDYAFNNAGIEGEQGETAECSLENFDNVIGVNLKGVFYSMKYEIPVMLENGGGAIVNCSSIAGLQGHPNLPAYVASKHGVVGLTKTAALEYAQREIRINAVCPGAISTAMLNRVMESSKEMRQAILDSEPVGRTGEPREVADAVLWLCSDEASFVTGTAFPVDGGWTAG